MDHNIILKDRFIGCMLSTHAGDALGMPVEGYDYKVIESNCSELGEMLEARMGMVYTLIIKR